MKNKYVILVNEMLTDSYFSDLYLHSYTYDKNKQSFLLLFSKDEIDPQSYIQISIYSKNRDNRMDRSAITVLSTPKEMLISSLRNDKTERAYLKRLVKGYTGVEHLDYQFATLRDLKQVIGMR